MDVIKEKFRPEFRNRINGIVEFKPLTEDSMEQIAKKSISVIADLLNTNRSISLKWNKTVDRLIAKEGFDPKMGARPIERKIEDLISKRISQMILRENLKKGSVIKISKARGKEELLFSIEKEI